MENTLARAKCKRPAICFPFSAARSLLPFHVTTLSNSSPARTSASSALKPSKARIDSTGSIRWHRPVPPKYRTSPEMVGASGIFLLSDAVSLASYFSENANKIAAHNSGDRLGLVPALLQARDDILARANILQTDRPSIELVE